MIYLTLIELFILSTFSADMHNANLKITEIKFKDKEDSSIHIDQIYLNNALLISDSMGNYEVPESFRTNDSIKVIEFLSMERWYRLSFTTNVDNCKQYNSFVYFRNKNKGFIAIEGCSESALSIPFKRVKLNRR